MRKICITSPKGGVGKDTISINLSYLIANKLNKKVLILDADVAKTDINIMLGLLPEKTLVDYLKKDTTLIDIISRAYGIDIISGSSGEVELLDIDMQCKKQIIDEIEKLDSYDYLIINTGAGLFRSILEWSFLADDIAMITDTDLTAISDTYHSIKVLFNNKTYLENPKEYIGLIINKAKIKEGIGIFNNINRTALKFLSPISKLKYLSAIPEDRHGMAMASIKQTPYLKLLKREHMEEMFLHIIENIENQEEQERGPFING